MKNVVFSMVVLAAAQAGALNLSAPKASLKSAQFVPGQCLPTQVVFMGLCVDKKDPTPSRQH